MNTNLATAKNIIYYLILSAAVFWCLFSKRSYTDLTYAQENFIAKANNLNKITGSINNSELAGKNITLKLFDTVTDKQITECVIIIKSGNMFKCKFPPIQNSMGKKYNLMLLIDNKNIIPVDIKSHYSLTISEAMPFSLANATLNKPFPLNQPWFHIGLLILYFIIIAVILRCLLTLTISSH